MSCASPHEQLCEDTARARQIPDLRIRFSPPPCAADRVHATVVAESQQEMDGTRMDAYIRHEVESVFAERSQGRPRSTRPPPPDEPDLPPASCLPDAMDCCRDDRGYDGISTNYRWNSVGFSGPVPLLLYPSWRGRLVNTCGWIDPHAEEACEECPPGIGPDPDTEPPTDPFRDWRTVTIQGRTVSWFNSLDQRAVDAWAHVAADTLLAPVEWQAYRATLVRAIDLLLRNADLAHWATCLIEGGYGSRTKLLLSRLRGPPDRYAVYVTPTANPAWPPFLGTPAPVALGALGWRYRINVFRVPVVQYWAAAADGAAGFSSPGDVFLAVAAVAAGILRGVLVGVGFEQSLETGDHPECKKVFRISNTWLWAIYQRYGVPHAGMQCQARGSLNSTCLINSNYTHFFPGPGNCGGLTFLGTPLMSGVADIYYLPAGVRQMATPWADEACPSNQNPVLANPVVRGGATLPTANQTR